MKFGLCKTHIFLVLGRGVFSFSSFSVYELPTMLRLQRGKSMDMEPDDWDDSDFDDDSQIYDRSSIKMYKFLPAPNLRLTGRSTTLNPVDKSNRADRNSRGTTFPIGRPKPTPNGHSEWDFHAYRFKLSDFSRGRKLVTGDHEFDHQHRARTTPGNHRFAGYRTLDFSRIKHGTKSASRAKGGLPPLESECVITIDPDNTVSPAMLRDILESEGVSKSTINQVVKEQSEKRTASYMAEDHLKRLAVPSLAKRPLPGQRAPDFSLDQASGGESCTGADGRSLPGNRLSPLSSPRHVPRQSLMAPWEHSKSFDESSDAQCGHRDLESWRTQREERLRPWAADVSPKHSPRGSRSDLEQIGLEYGEKTKDKLDSYSMEIEKTKWLSELQMERTFYRKGATLPRIILVSSKVPKASQVEKVIRQEKHLVYVPYDYDLLSLDDILGKVKNALQTYRVGCKAKSVAIVCQGGPGYMYLQRRKVLTPQKLANPANKDIIDFWRNLGDCLTKMDPGGAAIHILGCCLVGNKQGEELLAELQRLLSSSDVIVENPLEISAKGSQVIETYFDTRRYRIWRSCQHSSADSINFGSMEDAEAKTAKDKFPRLTCNSDMAHQK